MKALLINPSTSNNSYQYTKLPPLGLIYLAACLRQSGNDVRIVDGQFSRNIMQDIKHEIQTYAPEVVGVSVLTPYANDAAAILDTAKKMNNRITTIIGGVHATIFPDDLCSHESVDYVVRGEGEITFPELLSCIEEGKDPSTVDGIAYSRNGDTVLTKQREYIEPLDVLPMPAYDMLQVGRYESSQLSVKPIISMITSRGCPYHCIYCDANIVMGRKFRAHSPERTVDEILYLKRHFGIREIIFKDSEFTLNKNRVREICELILKKELDILWTCNSRVGSVDPALLRIMKKAGCRVIQYGVESGDQAILERLKKNITIDEIRSSFNDTHRASIKTVANLMVGNPGESRETVARTMDLVKEIKADYINVSYITPFPGTELYKMAKLEKWFIDPLEEIGRDTGKCIMNATKMSTKELRKKLNLIYRKFYFRPGYIFKRILTSSPFEWKMNIIGLLRILSKSTKD
ncbi:MAG: cobalamin-dependent protein [Nitrospirota bacterium]|nr:MAG: cobalamin-dependent protein [Nitrospirota bacterium]